MARTRTLCSPLSKHHIYVVVLCPVSTEPITKFTYILHCFPIIYRYGYQLLLALRITEFCIILYRFAIFPVKYIKKLSPLWLVYFISFQRSKHFLYIKYSWSQALTGKGVLCIVCEQLVYRQIVLNLLDFISFI